MAIFSDYVRRVIPFLGGTVALDIRALDKAEAPDFKADAERIKKLWGSSDRLPDEPEAAFVVRLQQLLGEIESYLRGVFTREKQTKTGVKGYYVRLAEVLENEDDDERSIRTCAQLFERGDLVFRFRVVTEIAELADVDPLLGNSSGSPSTSSVATSPNTSAEAANTTAESGSTSPSTATAASAPGESSTPPA